MMMSVEQSVECESAGETDVLGETLSYYYLVRHKYHIT
jgi:hypothetical protein